MPSEPWYAPGLSFACTQCGQCCSGPPGYIWFTEAEGRAIAAHLKLQPAEFLQRFAHQVNGRWSLNETLTEHGHDCTFLRRDAHGKALCSIYSVRPQQCRTWPFWPENLSSPQNWRRAAVRCPGVAAGNEGQGKFYPVEQIRIIRDGHPKA